MQWEEIVDNVAQAIMLEWYGSMDEEAAMRLARAAIREMNAIRLRDVILGDQ